MANPGPLQDAQRLAHVTPLGPLGEMLFGSHADTFSATATLINWLTATPPPWPPCGLLHERGLQAQREVALLHHFLRSRRTASAGETTLGANAFTAGSKSRRFTVSVNGVVAFWPHGRLWLYAARRLVTLGVEAA